MFTSSSTDSVTSQKNVKGIKTMKIKEEKNVDSHKEAVETVKIPIKTQKIAESSFKTSQERPESLEHEEASGMMNMNFMNGMTPENIASMGNPLANPLMYMNPMLLGNPQIPVNPVIPSLANQIAANQLLANQMMLRQFLMSGQMYPQTSQMLPSNPLLATDAALQQLVAKRQQAPPNVNMFQPQEAEPIGFHGDQQKKMSLPGKRKSPSSSRNHQMKRPRVEGSRAASDDCHDDRIVRSKRAEEEVMTKKKSKKQSQSKMLAGKTFYTQAKKKNHNVLVK